MEQQFSSLLYIFFSFSLVGGRVCEDAASFFGQIDYFSKSLLVICIKNLYFCPLLVIY